MYQRKLPVAAFLAPGATCAVSITRNLPPSLAERSRSGLSRDLAEAVKAEDGESIARLWKRAADESAIVRAAIDQTRAAQAEYADLIAALGKGEIPPQPSPVVNAASEAFGIAQLVREQDPQTNLPALLAEALGAVIAAHDALAEAVEIAEGRADRFDSKFLPKLAKAVLAFSKTPGPALDSGLAGHLPDTWARLLKPGADYHDPLTAAALKKQARMIWNRDVQDAKARQGKARTKLVLTSTATKLRGVYDDAG